MKGWRPEGWKNPFDEEIESMEAECRKRGIDPTWHGEAGVGQKAYEAGADEILEGLWKLAEESPTKTFTIDARGIHIYKGGENGSEPY